jgi:4-alpha-glucanotransferase
VKAGQDALQDVTLKPAELYEKRRVAKDCARVLGWLGDYAGLPLQESLVPWGQGIKDALFSALFNCRSVYAALMWTELFDVPVRLNTPGTQGGANWRPRMPFTAAQAAGMPQSEWVAQLSRIAGR